MAWKPASARCPSALRREVVAFSSIQKDFASLGRIAPDPVAFVQVGVARLGQSDFAAVVGFVPPDRVEDKLAVVGAAVFERLAVDDVVRQLLDELRRERLERFRELAVRQPVSLQRAGDAGEVNGGLGAGALLGDSGPGRAAAFSRACRKAASAAFRGLSCACWTAAGETTRRSASPPAAAGISRACGRGKVCSGRTSQPGSVGSTALPRNCSNSAGPEASLWGRPSHPAREIPALRM